METFKSSGCWFGVKQNPGDSIAAALSGIEDADLTKSITELNQANLQQQAALQSRARIPRTTLFDYLA